MTRNLRGRTAIVTGSAAGIGQAFAERLAIDGANVVIADLSEAGETIKRITDAGGEGLAVRCDVSNPDDVRRLGEEARRRFGHIEILVNNAGIYPFMPFEQVTWEIWRKVLAVNLDSQFLMCREFVPAMKEKGWGRVVNVSSGSPWVMLGGDIPYTASKAGVVGFTRALATELGPFGITVNSLAPSIVKTKTTVEMMKGLLDDIPAATQAIKRLETPEDLVGALSFLVSDDAAFITAQTLMVDGGRVRV